MDPQLKYLTLILDNDAPSFCYYKYNPESDHARMSMDIFTKTIDYATTNNLSINLIKSETPLSETYLTLLRDVNHIIIEPLNKQNKTNNSIKIAHFRDIYCNENFDDLCDNSFIILKLQTSETDGIFDTVKKIIRKALRINLMFEDIENVNATVLKKYYEQLEQISELMVNYYTQDKNIFLSELNFITDRMYLSAMQNCDAGISHITVAPDGNFYVCPGFYYQFSNQSIGSIGSDFNIKNKPLLTLDKSPICKSCDSFHCKRCIFLNKKLTNEINTPSYQQCKLSHAERNASQKLISKLHKNKLFRNLNEIKEISYDDPLDLIKSLPSN